MEKNLLHDSFFGLLFFSLLIPGEESRIKNSHVTAASTPAAHVFGYVFNDCVLTGDTTLNKVSLGRPWRPYASVTYLHCYLDKHIMAQGWANWNNTDNYKTTRYAEYRITGRV